MFSNRNQDKSGRSVFPRTRITDTKSTFVEDNFEMIETIDNRGDIFSSINFLCSELEEKSNVFMNLIDLMLDFYNDPLNKLNEILKVLGSSSVDVLGQIRNYAKTLVVIDQDFRSVLYTRLGYYKNNIRDEGIKRGAEATFNSFDKMYGELLNRLADKFTRTKLFTDVIGGGLNLFDRHLESNNMFECIEKCFDNYSDNLINKISCGNARLLFSRDTTQNFDILSYGRIKGGSKYLNIPDNIKIKAFLGMLLGNAWNSKHGNEPEIEQDLEKYQDLMVKQNESLNLLIDIYVKADKDILNEIGYETVLNYDLSNLPENYFNKIEKTVGNGYDVFNLSQKNNTGILGDNTAKFKLLNCAAKLGSVIQAQKALKLEHDKDNIYGRQMQLSFATQAYNASLDECRHCGILNGISPEGKLDKSKLPSFPPLPEM